ncbi:hypothetical protein [Streptomyces mirabilis]|uniref:hypothetical protein n=1 Tax=Streptomyces mirabilis TaxID=68239 RepID=UPI003F750024
MPGCGRAYRERLWEQWGAVDMEDRVAAPQTLALIVSSKDRRRFPAPGVTSTRTTTAARTAASV